jgi:hypothetical protein
LHIPVIDTPESGLTERIKSLVSALHEGIRGVAYEQQIDMPYSGKIVFVDSDEAPHPDKGRRRPLKLRNSRPRETVDPSPWAARRKAARLFIMDWLLPPKFSQLVVAIKNAILRRD